MAINKIIYGGTTLIDLTSDTVDAAYVLNGYTFHGKDGVTATGTCDYDMDTSSMTASASEILSGKTAGVSGNTITGTMTNNGSVAGTISTVSGSYTVPQGYHDGGGSVTIDSTEAAKCIASNIKSGVVLLGVTGTYTGASISAQTKTVTPTTSSQTITPDSGYDYLSQVTVEAIPYTTTSNTYGTTVTIG